MKLYEIFQDNFINHYKTENGLTIMINKDEREFMNKYKNNDIISESDLDEWNSNLAFKMCSKGLLKQSGKGYTKR